MTAATFPSPPETLPLSRDYALSPDYASASRHGRPAGLPDCPFFHCVCVLAVCGKRRHSSSCRSWVSPGRAKVRAMRNQCCRVMGTKSESKTRPLERAPGAEFHSDENARAFDQNPSSEMNKEFFACISDWGRESVRLDAVKTSRFCCCRSRSVRRARQVPRVTPRKI
jgi:hypothetical protein